MLKWLIRCSHHCEGTGQLREHRYPKAWSRFSSASSGWLSKSGAQVPHKREFSRKGGGGVLERKNKKAGMPRCLGLSQAEQVG